MTEKNLVLGAIGAFINEQEERPTNDVKLSLYKLLKRLVNEEARCTAEQFAAVNRELSNIAKLPTGEQLFPTIQLATYLNTCR